MKLSRDKCFLVGYVNTDGDEVYYVYSTVKHEKIWEGMLDLQGGNIREDPMKLIVFSEDCVHLFSRTNNNKGVCMHSLYDGTKI